MEALKKKKKKKKKRTWDPMESLISGLPRKKSRGVLISFFISNPFITRPHLMETKTTNYCANNVSCGGPSFHA